MSDDRKPPVIDRAVVDSWDYGNVIGLGLAWRQDGRDVRMSWEMPCRVAQKLLASLSAAVGAHQERPSRAMPESLREEIKAVAGQLEIGAKEAMKLVSMLEVTGHIAVKRGDDDQD